LAELSVYLDASVVVPIFLLDPFIDRTRIFLQSNTVDIIVSDFVSAEFAAVVGRRLRMKILKTDEARTAFANLDSWVSVAALPAETTSSDVQSARRMLHRLDLTLRAPDAVNLAIAQRLGAELATFDIRMADCARALGIVVVAL
jgi:predicted nucleic acid-binding protein